MLLRSYAIIEIQGFQGKNVAEVEFDNHANTKSEMNDPFIWSISYESSFLKVYMERNFCSWLTSFL